MSEPTISELVQRYLTLACPKLVPESQRNARDILHAFVKDYGKTLPSKLKAIQVAEWIGGHEAWKSLWTRKRALQTLKRLLNWAEQMTLIEKNVLRWMNEPNPEPQRPMTDDEFRAVLKHSAGPFKRIMLFLFLTGARPGEARTLEWSMIDWQRRVAILPHHKTRKKTHKPRLIPLPAAVIKLLGYLKRRTPAALRKNDPGAYAELCLSPMPKGKDQNLVFLNSLAKPWTKSAFNLHFYRLRERAFLSKDCKPYGLRHRYCTQAIRSGVQMKVVASLMGHASVAMSEYYSHLGDDHEALVNAAEQTNAYRPRKDGAT